MTHSARRFSLEQLRHSIIEASEERGHAKGAGTTALRVLLLSFSTETSDELDSRLILILEAEALALNAHLVDKDPSVSLQSSKSYHHVLINALNLTDGTWVLKLRDCVFLDGKDNTVASNEGNSGTTTIHSLEGVLHLEELAVGRENSVCDIV